MTPHKIIKSKRRTLSLSINENAELIVRAPNRISNKQIENFIIEKFEDKFSQTEVYKDSYDKELVDFYDIIYKDDEYEKENPESNTEY